METGEPQGEAHAPCREIIAALKAAMAEQIALLRNQVAQQDKRIRELEARLKQNSRNSSRPPSSDPPSAPPRLPKPPTGRSPGGQPGHEGNTYTLAPADQVDEVVSVKPERCEECGERLSGEDPSPLRHQVTEIPPVHPLILEYLLHRLTCPKCAHRTTAKLPKGVSPTMMGPALQAMVAYLTGHLHLSKRVARDALQDLFDVTVSTGSISAAEQAVSEAVAAPVEKAREFVQAQPHVNGDETGWRERRKKAWLWVATTPWVSIFLIHAKRGADAARELLGKFAGYLTTDRWNAYNGWKLRRRQICWAHLIRDFKGFLERGAEAARLGEALLAQTKEMFDLWRRVRDRTLARSSFRLYMSPIRGAIEDLLRQGTCCGESKTEGMCKKILQVAPALWTFVRVEGIDPTNNAAERAIRPAVLYRKGCFGTHSAAGSRFVERILTVTITLRKQGRNVLDFLTQACVAAAQGHRPPSLLPTRRMLRQAGRPEAAA
jgi:transposase